MQFKISKRRSKIMMHCKLLSAEGKWTPADCRKTKASTKSCMRTKVKRDLPVKSKIIISSCYIGLHVANSTTTILRLRFERSNRV